MSFLHTVAAGHAIWATYAVSLIVGLAPEVLAVVMRGFGRRGFGRRGFGRGLGAFRLIRVLFVLLFTTILGPIVLVALLAFGVYWFYVNRQRR